MDDSANQGLGSDKVRSAAHPVDSGRVTRMGNGADPLNLVRSMADAMTDMVIVTTADPEPPGPQIVYVNKGFTATTGYSAAEVIGKTPRILQGAKSDRAELDRLRDSLGVEGRFDGRIVNYGKDGREFVLDWTVLPIHDARGDVSHWVSIQHELSDPDTASTATIRSVLIIDGKAIVRGTDRQQIRRLGTHVTFGDARGYRQAHRQLQKSGRFDLIVAAFSPPSFGTINELSELCEAASPTPVVVFSPEETDQHIRAAFAAGAAGIVTRSIDPHIIPQILKLVVVGGRYVPPHILGSNAARSTSATADDLPIRRLSKLTRRQREIVELLAEGMSNEDISERLGISINTVKGHVTRTLRALGVKNRTQAALLPLRPVSAR